MDRQEINHRYKTLAIAERASTAAHTRFQQALSAFRLECPHDGVVVELRAEDWSIPAASRPDGNGSKLASRFCLTCGLMERAEEYTPSGDGVFPLTGGASQVCLKDYGTDLSRFLEAFRPYDQWLRILGRVDQFDAQGEWIGPQDQIALGNESAFDATPALARIAALNDSIDTDTRERGRIVSALQSTCPHEGEIIDRHVETIVFPHDDRPDSPRRTCLTCLFEEVGTRSGFPGVHDFKVLTARSATRLSVADYDARRYELLQQLGLDFLIKC